MVHIRCWLSETNLSSCSCSFASRINSLASTNRRWCVMGLFILYSAVVSSTVAASLSWYHLVNSKYDLERKPVLEQNVIKKVDSVAPSVLKISCVWDGIWLYDFHGLVFTRLTSPTRLSFDGQVGEQFRSISYGTHMKMTNIMYDFKCISKSLSFLRLIRRIVVTSKSLNSFFLLEIYLGTNKN